MRKNGAKFDAMSEIYKIEITTTAEVEGNEAIAWIRQFSPAASKKFSEGLTKAILSLRQNPFRCSLAPENNFFYEEIRQLLYAKYRILITIDEETVYILHIRHSSQRYVRKKFDNE